MSAPGMWMPKRKSGKNWIVRYSGLDNGKHFEQTRTFRVRADAERFVDDARALLLHSTTNAGRFADVTFAIDKYNRT